MSEMRQLDLLLVSMPWASTARPSLGVGRLVSLAKAAGFRAQAAYPSIAFADLLDLESYETLADTPAFFGLAEHVFAVDLYGREALRSDELLAQAGDAVAGVFSAIRDDLVAPFLERLVPQLLTNRPRCIGFSATFNQVMPSLAAARRLRDAGYDGRIILGGACVHGEMGREYQRACAGLVDDVFLGEADASLPAYLSCLAAGGSDADLRAIAESEQFAGSAELSAVPPPDYDDWYADRHSHASGGGAVAEVSSLPIEASRGCWWGEKNHCVFCGLNNKGIAYRARSAGSAVAEIDHLARRHQCLAFTAADNIIAREHIDELADGLASRELDVDLFFEVKSNLSRREVAALRRMGVKSVQPGIESFANSVLRTMRKGVRGLSNIQTLRLCREYGILVSWNLLGGFADETIDDYREIARLCQAVRHLDPPSGNMSIAQVHRFSPFFDEPDRHGIGAIEPCGYYRHWFPPGEADIGRLAYFFERTIPPDAACHEGVGLVNAVVEEWRRHPETGHLRLGPGFIEWTRATRDGSERRVLDIAEASALLLADSVTGAATLERALEARGMPCEAIVSLVDAGLLLREGKAVVSVFPFMPAQAPEALHHWLDQFAPEIRHVNRPVRVA